MKKVVLHGKKVDAVLRFHPWIFSGAIKFTDAQDGDWVEVVDPAQNFLAMGYYSSNSSIAVRVLSFEKITKEAIWLEKIKKAVALREQINLFNNPATNCFRLINAEGDGIPGLIIDFYNGTCVFQAHNNFIHNQKEQITAALVDVLKDRLVAVFDKSEAMLAKKKMQESKDSFLYGKPTTNLVVENNHSFEIDWAHGQKTGFFLDQRDNRNLIAQYANGKKILNTFCYSGGFSIYAMKAGAAEVHSLDSSQKAIELTEKNIQLNQFEKLPHQSFTQDIFDFFKTANTDEYDIIVLDPPAFAKNINARHQAVQAYKRLNKVAFEKIKKGGIVFTFSCSQAVTTEFFNGAVMAAAIEAKREVQILHHLSQPADHPTSIFHPEGNYLKGLVLCIN